MKKNPESDFERFENLARHIVNVPRSVIKKKLDEEKKKKGSRKIKQRASREAGGPT